MITTVLPAIRKTDMVPAFRSGRVECWGAETADGEWSFEREESSGTPWIVYHNPSVRDGSYRLPVCSCGSLIACRKVVASGWAARRLAEMKEEGRDG